MRLEWDDYVEVKVTIFAEYNKEEGDGWNSPKIPAHVQINDIELEDDLKNKILEEHYEKWQEDGFDHVETDYGY